MQLRSMTLQAIGPFATKHAVDFEALSASGLFLLEGPTGSGKSTLIDAVVFALYGKVASDDASDDRLRSAYADEDTESFVDLTFEVASGIYRVRRTPAYDRAKKRGTGTVRQQASVRLWRVSPDDPTGEVPGSEPVTRLDEAGLEIERAVGLSRTQFVQTIVLPQGEFSKFLRAKPEDRRGLLQKIFGTEVYERMQQRLVELRAEVAREVEGARAAVQTATARLVGAAGLDDQAAAELREQVLGHTASVAGGPDVSALASMVDERSHALEAQARTDREAAALADQQRQAAGVALEEQSRLERLLSRRARLQADRAALDQDLTAYTERVLRLERARAAAAVRPLLDSVSRARAEVATARKAVLAAGDAAPAQVAGLVAPVESVLDAPAGERGERLRGLVTLRSGATHDAAALDRVVGLEAALNDRRRAVRDARDQAEALRDQIAADDAWLAERPQERAALAERLTVAAAAAARLAEHEARLETLTAAANAHVRLDALVDECAAAALARDACARAATEAVAHEAALRTARIAGLAGELAAALTDADACPVCGSVEHPAKAPLADDHVTADDVERGERARVSAEKALSSAGENHAGLVGRVVTARESLGDTTAEQVLVDLTAARGALEDAREAATLAEQLTNEIEAHAGATDARAAQRQESQARLAEIAGRIDVLRLALESDEAEVAQACAGHPTVVARRSELYGLVEAATELVAAFDDLAEAERGVHGRGAELDAALAERDFASSEDAEEAFLDRAALAALAETVADYAGAVEAARAGLAEPEIAELAADAHADVAAAREVEREARGALVAAEGCARVSGERAQAVATAGAGVLAAARALAEVWERGGPVTRLAGIASGTGGDNGRNLSLATYVLTRRFEDVVAAANERLLGMSDGRYELVRSEQKEDVGSRRTGLAMRVVDHWTDQQRDPRTLSGGESFYVSLCLALGMADVVTAEAGGIDLGTLFVDEGFGSLDPHTLDQVLAELGKLRAGGRVVGVVSHVEALKSTIADRIEVRPGADGPSTLRVLAS